MFTPGPIISGFSIPGLGKLGPLEEKDAMAGDCEFPIIVPLNETVAVGVEVEFI
jgi:hypothetical protein